MADFDVAFEEGCVDDGLGEFVAHAHELFGARGYFAVGTVGEGGSLALGVLFLFGVGGGGEDGVLGDVDSGEFELGFLFECWVGGRGVGAETV